MTSPSIYSFEVRNVEHAPIQMELYRDKVLLIVNVASKCGFTPQYTGLESLQQKFGTKGFTVLAFPCNQFGGQEPGDEKEILSFCETNYAVTFPLFEKLLVNGEDAHPLYKHLKSAAPGLLGTEAIKWNFTKFLIDRRGQVVDRFAPSTTPESIEGRVQEVLAQ